MTVVTRFAPSPTGYLHIGGARTALFNWLFARSMAGRFLLRIEDTDRERSTQAAIDAILDGMSWLGLDADEAPIFQFARAARHREAAEQMVARGAAFRCYCTDEEVAALRAQAHAEGRALRSPFRDGNVPPPHADAPYVVRLRAPDHGEIVNEDLVQGPVTVRARDIDDLVLLRADGTPTYMLAVVVDDHDMGVTHVIRGDDHLTNAARQIPLFRALDWSPPAYAHIPLIHGPDGAKLSKRHGALGVQAYRDMGYLPEGLLAYLMRLGWGRADDGFERIEDAAKRFSLEHLNKSPSRLDFAKLDSINAAAMKLADDARLAELALTAPPLDGSEPLSPGARGRILAAMPALKQRAKTVTELSRLAFFLGRARPFALDEAAMALIKGETLDRLKRLRSTLDGVAWDEASLSEALKAFAAAEGVGLGKIGPAVRAVLTGGAPALDLGQTLSYLGREETLARLDDQLDRA